MRQVSTHEQIPLLCELSDSIDIGSAGAATNHLERKKGVIGDLEIGIFMHLRLEFIFIILFLFELK